MNLKRLLVIVLILTLALAACRNQQSGENDSVNEEPKTSNELDTKLVQEFSNQIAVAASPMELKKNLDEMMKETNTKTADALVIEYLAFQESFLQKGIDIYADEINDLNQYFDLETESIDVTTIKESDLKDFYQSFTKAGFKFITLEGMLNPIVDYQYLAAYKAKVSPGISEYGSLMAMNSDKPWARDAGIAITLNELADRIAITEMYLSEYPNSVMKEKVISQYTLYLRGFLVGLDNTSLVSQGAKEVDAQFIKSFYYFIDTYPDLKATELVQLYVNELERTKLAPPYHDEEQKAAFLKRIDEKIKDITDQY